MEDTDKNIVNNTKNPSIQNNQPTHCDCVLDAAENALSPIALAAEDVTDFILQRCSNNVSGNGKTDEDIILAIHQEQTAFKITNNNVITISQKMAEYLIQYASLPYSADQPIANPNHEAPVKPTKVKKVNKPLRKLSSFEDRFKFPEQVPIADVSIN